MRVWPPIVLNLEAHWALVTVSPPALGQKGISVGKRDAGFALVISLLLMGFVLLLLLSLSVVVKVETQNSSMQRVQDSARMNALLGLQVALGELQNYAGPDQRVSARAEVLSDPFSADSTPANPLWTGVWDGEGALLTWLVSGNNGQSPVGDDWYDAADWQNVDASIELASARGSQLAVQVPLVDVDSSAGDRFAYWVVDEGVKAKLQTGNGLSDDEYLVSAQRYGVELIAGFDWFDREDTRVQRIMGLDDLGLIHESSSDTFEESFHDVTTHGFGLLTNARDGGLKVDLTTALFDGPLPGNLIFEPQLSKTPTSRDPGGPRWDQLSDWAKYDASSGGALSVQATSNEQAGLFPIITAIQLYWLPNYVPEDHAIYLHLIPTVVLWNPYDQAIEATDYRVEIARANYEASLPGQVRDFEGFYQYWRMFIIEPDGTELDDFKLHPTPSTSVLKFDFSQVRIEPGEAMVFSPPANQHSEFDPNNSNPPFSSHLLTPGYRPEWSYYYKIADTSGLVASDGGPISNIDFVYTAHLTRIYGFRLSQRVGNDYIPISESSMKSLDSDEIPSAPMPSFPLTSFIGEDVRQGRAIGPKSNRLFVDNSYTPTSTIPQKSVKWLAHHNPRASFSGANPFVFREPASIFNYSRINNPSFVTALESDGTNQSIGVDSFSDPLVAVGFRDGGAVDRSILFEASPGRERLHSVGQLMHAPLFNWGIDTNDTSLKQRFKHGRFDNLIPAYAIGNSLADPRIPLDAKFVDWMENPGATLFQSDGLHYDYSYLLNDALWDNYYFSTLPAGSQVPANPRLVALPELLPSDGSVDNPSEWLVLDGAFNVNSTSVAAWKALLGAFFGLPSGDHAGGDFSAYSRLLDPSGELFYNDSAVSSASADAHNGVRVLSEDQINQLAEAIVDEVKMRGPFTNLASFINRMPEKDADTTNMPLNAFRLRGALSAALQGRSATGNQPERESLNSQLEDFPSVSSGIAGMVLEAEAGARSEGILAWLTQADLLSKLGSVLTVRTDTFRIRVCGESATSNHAGVGARVYGEAIVQRTPEFISGAVAESELSSLSSKDIRFGRRFVVIDFRWLSEDEL